VQHPARSEQEPAGFDGDVAIAHTCADPAPAARSSACAIELRWAFGVARVSAGMMRRRRGGGVERALRWRRHRHVIESARWDLETSVWENRTLAGEVSHPLGEDASGYIAYSEDGYVFVAIMGAAREPFVAGDLLSGSTAEQARAAETYVSYCGRYEFRGDTVLHHEELSLFPNWVGFTQERLVEISGDRLALSTRPLLLQGRQQTAHLLWERL